MEKKIIIECTNCKLQKELIANISLERLDNIATQFLKEHRRRVGNMYCKKGNLFIRNYI